MEGKEWTYIETSITSSFCHLTFTPSYEVGINPQRPSLTSSWFQVCMIPKPKLFLQDNTFITFQAKQERWTVTEKAWEQSGACLEELRTGNDDTEAAF